MLIKCAACQATYRLNVEMIPSHKTYVKCKSCQSPIYLSAAEENNDDASLTEEELNEKISIECDQCTTKYQVSRSRMMAGKNKVKCVKCQHVFSPDIPPARSQLPQAEQAYLESVDLGPEESSDTPDELSEIASQKYNVFRKPGPLVSKEATEKLSDLLAHTQSLEDVEEHEEHEGMLGSELDDFLDDDTEASVDTEASTDAEESADFGEAMMDSEDEMEEGTPEFEPSFDEASADIPSEPEGFEPQRSHSTLPVIEEHEIERRSKRRKAVVVWMLILLAFGALGSGGYFVSQHPELVYKWIGISPHQLKIVQGSLKGKRVRNHAAQQVVFVVEGKVRNQFPTEKQISWVQLKGLAYGKKEDLLETAIVYAGNVLSQAELENWDLERIQNFYTYNNGRNNANYELKQGQEVPFQMVFLNAAQDIENVVAKAISYVRENQPIYVKE